MKYAFATATVTTATGGAISASKAVNGSSAGYTTLGNIVITEAAQSDFAINQSSTTLILTAPSGWAFNAGVGSVSFTASQDITSASMVVTTSTATVTLSTDGTANKTDTLTISGLQVQSADKANVPGSGNILSSGTASIAGVPNGTNLGSLSQTDTTAPTGPTGLNSSHGTTSSDWSTDNTVNMSWIAATDTESGIAGYSYVFDTTSNTTPDTTTELSSGITTVDSSALSTGNSHYFHIRAVDAAGNGGTAQHAGPFWIDTTAPSVPGTPSTTTPTNDNTPTWTWTASTDANSGLPASPYTVEWSQAADFSSTTGTSTSTTNAFTHSTPLADGTYYVRVKAQDTVGNVSAYSSNGTVVVDTTGPTTVLNAYTPDPSADNTPTYTGTATDTLGTVASVQFSTDGGSNWSTATADDGAFDEASETFSFTTATLTPDGSKTVQARATDSLGSVGSTSSDTVTVDTAAPNAGSLIINSNSTYTNSTNVTLAISASDVTSSVTQMNVYNGSSFNAANWESYATSKAWVLPSGQGSHTVNIRFRDAAGNENTSLLAQDSIILDSVAPSVANVLISNGTGNNTYVKNGDSVTVTADVTDTNQAAMSTTSITADLSGLGGSATANPDTYNNVTGVATWNAFNVTGTANGTVTVTVTATDPATNASNNNDTITADNTAPSVTASNASSSWQQSSPTITLSASDATSGLNNVRYQWNSATNIATAGTVYTDAATINVPSEGTNQLYLYASDVAGNTVTSSNFTYMVDTNNPAVTATGASSGWQTSLPTITISATDTTPGSAISAVKYAWDGTADATNGTLASDGANITLTYPADGTHTLNLYVVDNSGRTGTNSLNYQIDRVAPGDAGTPSTTPSPTNLTTQTWLWTAATDAVSLVDKYFYRVMSGSNTVIASTQLGNVLTVGTSLVEGVYDFFVKAGDTAGNVGNETTTSLTVDTSVPSTATLSIDSDALYTNTTSVTLTISAADNLTGVAEMAFSNDDVTYSSWEAYNTTKSWILTSGDQSKTVYVKFRDGAGNENAAGLVNDSIILDTTAPTVPGTPSTTTPTADNTPTWTWTVSDDTPGIGLHSTPYTIQWSQDATFAAGVSTNTSTTNSYTHTAALADGTWYVRVNAKDALGNTSAYSSNGTVFVDTTAPSVPGTPSTATPTNDTTPTWNWSASNDGTGVGLHASAPYLVQWSQDNTFSTGVLSSGSTVNSFTQPTGLADGTWYFRVLSQDALNNQSAYSSNGSVLVDTVAPVVSNVLISNDTTSDNNYVKDGDSVTITATITDVNQSLMSASSITANLSALGVGSSTTAAGSYDTSSGLATWNAVTVTNSANGVTTVTVSATDAAANVSATASDSITNTTGGYMSSETNNIAAPSNTAGSVELPSDVVSVTLNQDTLLDLTAGTSTASAGNIVIDGAPVALNNFLVLIPGSAPVSVDISNPMTIGSDQVVVNKAVLIESGTDGAAINLTNINFSNTVVLIPDETVIMGPSSWNGMISGPRIVAAEGNLPAGFQHIGRVIEVGATDATLLFNKAVSIVMADYVGEVAFKAHGSNQWTQVTNSCGGTYDAPVAAPFPGECYISNGRDTKILTYHFTSFAGISKFAIIPSAQASPASSSTTTTTSASNSTASNNAQNTSSNTSSQEAGSSLAQAGTATSSTSSASEEVTTPSAETLPGETAATGESQTEGTAPLGASTSSDTENQDKGIFGDMNNWYIIIALLLLGAAGYYVVQSRRKQ